jgi:phospholipid/cholesterol/gamma-HCH transport system ATP-binding protein
MSSPIISVRDLVVRYGTHQVLNGVNLDVERGEVLVLLGGSGSGKSTMLRQIIGLDRPSSGTVYVQGVDINRCTPQELKRIRRTMGVTFQESALFNSLSIEENVGLPLRELTKLAEPVIEIMTYMKLAAVGLGEAGKQMPQELSGGMKKRAAVARAIALDPEILIFDEPSAGLDPIVGAALDELILFLKQAFHMTILVVTHEMASAFRIADRVAMLYRGELIAVDNKESFQASADPRIRQFLDRRPDRLTDTVAVQSRLRELAGATS